MAEKKKNVVFRRVRGRIVPIKVKGSFEERKAMERKAKREKFLKVGAASGILGSVGSGIAGSYYAGKMDRLDEALESSKKAGDFFRKTSKPKPSYTKKGRPTAKYLRAKKKYEQYFGQTFDRARKKIENKQKILRSRSKWVKRGVVGSTAVLSGIATSQIFRNIKWSEDDYVNVAIEESSGYVATGGALALNSALYDAAKSGNMKKGAKDIARKVANKLKSEKVQRFARTYMKKKWGI